MPDKFPKEERAEESAAEAANAGIDGMIELPPLSPASPTSCATGIDGMIELPPLSPPNLSLPPVSPASHTSYATVESVDDDANDSGDDCDETSASMIASWQYGMGKKTARRRRRRQPRRLTAELAPSEEKHVEEHESFSISTVST